MEASLPRPGRHGRVAPALITLGRPVDVRVLAHEAIISGVARDVDDDEKRLIIELAGGERRHFAAGDVTLRGAP
ncbi:MAG: hypothetical protein R2854_27480 [Caldilineaceae bacterium]